MRILFSIIVFISFLGCKTGKESGETLPGFELQLSDGVTRFNTDTIGKGHPIALLYFSPDCEHCQAETEHIVKSIDSLKNIQILFVTNQDLEDMKVFRSHYGLDKYPNIVVGRDDQFFMIRHFKGLLPPTLILYDKKKNQQKIYGGQTLVSQLLTEANHL